MHVRMPRFSEAHSGPLAPQSAHTSFPATAATRARCSLLSSACAPERTGREEASIDVPRCKDAAISCSIAWVLSIVEQTKDKMDEVNFVKD
jgi:hypothetical protein